MPDLRKEVDIAGGSLFFFLARLRIFCILYKGKGWIKLFFVDFNFRVGLTMESTIGLHSGK